MVEQKRTFKLEVRQSGWIYSKSVGTLKSFGYFKSRIIGCEDIIKTKTLMQNFSVLETICVLIKIWEKIE